MPRPLHVQQRLKTTTNCFPWLSTHSSFQQLRGNISNLWTWEIWKFIISAKTQSMSRSKKLIWHYFSQCTFRNTQFDILCQTLFVFGDVYIVKSIQCSLSSQKKRIFRAKGFYSRQVVREPWIVLSVRCTSVLESHKVVVAPTLKKHQ